jgi:hypothetical protein
MAKAEFQSVAQGIAVSASMNCLVCDGLLPKIRAENFVGGIDVFMGSSSSEWCEA